MGNRLQRQLARVRAGIDAVDDEIVRQLAKRRELVLRLVRLKRALAIPIYDRRREKALIARVKRRGRRSGLDGTFLAALFSRIVANSKRMQRRAP